VEVLQSNASFEKVPAENCCVFHSRHPVSSGRVAGILRIAAAGGFKHGLQHDCHEALTFILSICHDEEIKLLKLQRRQNSMGDADGQEYAGVIARNFGIMERVQLTVRALHCGFALVLPSRQFSNIFGSARVVMKSVQSSTLGSLFLFLWVVALPFRN
jgi:hypothetical protein